MFEELTQEDKYQGIINGYALLILKFRVKSSIDDVQRDGRSQMNQLVNGFSKFNEHIDRTY